MAKVDGRGSHLQRDIFALCQDIYPKYDIVYEYPIGDLGQRIDIFIPHLGIALEIDGKQHFEFTRFFHKDETSWYSSIRLDEQKEKYLEEKGVKLVRIPFDTKIKTSSELKELIDSIEYPDVDYIEIPTEHSHKKHVKDTYKKEVKEFLDSKYKEVKEDFYKEVKKTRKNLYKQKKDDERALLKEQKAQERLSKYKRN